MIPPSPPAQKAGAGPSVLPHAMERPGI